MSLNQIISEVRVLDRAVADQITVVDGFTRTNRENIQLVNTFLKGSTKGHDRRMLEALDQAETKLAEAKAQLQRANDALQRVQMI